MSFDSLFRRLVPRLGAAKAIWAVAHRMLRIIWRSLHLGERYQEDGPLIERIEIVQRRFRRISRQLAAYGFYVQLTTHAKPTDYPATSST